MCVLYVLVKVQLLDFTIVNAKMHYSKTTEAENLRFSRAFTKNFSTYIQRTFSYTLARQIGARFGDDAM